MDALSALTGEPLDPSSPTPLYQQLRDRITQVIATRAFDATTPLPTEEQIAEALGLARGTVRRCFADLVDEGVVVRKRGKGTFVAWGGGPHTIGTAFNFTAEVQALGMEPSSRVLSLRQVAAHAGVSRRLRVEDGTPVWEIRRVRCADGRPLQHVTAYVPRDACPELAADDLTASLYTLIAEASGRMPARAEEVYEAVSIDAAEARSLELPVGSPALRVLRTTYDQHGRPFETSVIVLRADRNRLAVRLDASGTTFSKVVS